MNDLAVALIGMGKMGHAIADLAPVPPPFTPG